MTLTSFLRKLAWAVFTIVFVVLLNFFLFRIMGDPTKLFKDPRLSPNVVENIRVRFGLDKPVINCFASLRPLEFRTELCRTNPFDTQFSAYVANLLRGNLGVSFHSQRPVAELLAERLWNTLLLIGAGQILAIIIGAFLGGVAAWKARTMVDYSSLLAGLAAWSLPTFWLGMLLLFWGSTQFGLPLGGMSTIGASYDSFWQRASDTARHMLLPTLTFTLVYIGEYLIITRSSLLETLSQDYVLTAKAKGLTTFQILKDHAFRNAMLPLVTLVAINLGFTVAGAVQIETVFSWPGLGLTIFEAVERRDYPVLQGAFFLLAVCVILANFLADILYSMLDPRVKV
ncbi:MAG: ABC transporter permease [Trueperaceae bacterium]